MSGENDLKGLPCVFWDDVLCSFRKNVKFGVTAGCFECPEYKRFELVMEKEDEEEGRFVEWAQSHPDAYARGEVPP